MQEVVLVEFDSREAPGPNGESPDPRIPPPDDLGHPAGASAGAWPRQARRWWRVSAGLALIVVVSTVVADRRESARLAALADVPGILAPLDGPVTELWHSDVSVWPGLEEVAGRLVGVEAHRDGSVDVVALDPLTGEAVWRAAARPSGAMDVGTSCALPKPPRLTNDSNGTPVVVCVVVDEAAATDEAAGPVARPTKARLLVLDATTGAVLSDGPTEPSTSVGAIGTDIVISHVDAAGRVHVARTDARGTTDRWTFTGPGPLPANPSLQDASVQVVDGLILVAAAGSCWVLSGDGDLVHAWTADPTTGAGGRVEVLHRGNLLVEPATTDGGASGSEVIDLATELSFTAEGYPVGAVPDDASLAYLILMQSAAGDDLVAYDIASGRRRWTTPGTIGGGLVVINGRVIHSGTDELRSIDGRTGETVWATPVERVAQTSLVSDGRLVLLTQPDPDGGVVLTAYGLDDGRLRWQADVADDLHFLIAFDGKLYGWADQGLIALGQHAA